MVPRKHKLLIGQMPYGGNGGIASTHPSVANWLIKNVQKMTRDERIEDVKHVDVCDTPAPMARNRQIEVARQTGCDLILMIDSDQFPDYELDYNKDTTQKPFWDTSFDFLYNHWEKGPCVIGAPYCGPSPHQNIYVFHWTNLRNEVANSGPRLDQYRREHAAIMSGIQTCAALPTGLILFDIRCFDLIEPPYFYYQYEGDGPRCGHCNQMKPGVQAKKSSTEDVTLTRDISLVGQAKLGYNPVYCNWDAWAGHVKPEVVGKPRPVFVDNVTAKFESAIKNGIRSDEKLIEVGGNEFANRPVNGVADMTPEPPQEESLWSDPDHNASVFDRLEQTNLVRRAVRPDGSAMIAEIGSYKGYTAKHFLKAIPNAHVACVDTWFAVNADPAGINMMQDGIFEQFKANCRDEIAAGKIEPLRGMSVAVAKAVEKGPSAGKFDLVYIDAGHEYEDVKADIEAWLPMVRDGGIIAGHDFDAVRNDGTSMFPGVRKAISEIFGDDFEHGAHGSKIWSHVVKKNSSQSGPRIKIKHWKPNPEVLARVEAAADGCKRVLEIGPGTRPFSKATHFVGHLESDLPNYHRLDASCERLPFPDKYFDFVYCRHVLEDIQNPQFLCDEMSRVARQGYLETPTPIFEMCKGVEATANPNEEAYWRGLIHHRHFVWNTNGYGLRFMPKLELGHLAVSESTDEFLRDLLNDGCKYWNTHLLWGGSIIHKTLLPERDFDLFSEYGKQILKACDESKESCDLFLSRLILPESAAPVATNGHAKKPRRRKLARR